MFKKIISISLMFILVFVGTNKTIAAQEPEKETITVYSTETEEWNNLLSGKMGRAENRIGDVLDYTGGYSGLSYLNYQLLFTTADYDLMDFKVYITSFSDNKKTREYEYDNGVRWLDKKNNNEYYIVPRDYPQNNKGAIEAINFPPNNDNYKQIIVKTEEEAQALTNIHYKVNVGDTVLEITLGDLLSNSDTHFHMASFMGLTRSGSWTFSDFYMSPVFRATYEKEIEPSKGADIYVNYIDEDTTIFIRRKHSLVTLENPLQPKKKRSPSTPSNTYMENRMASLVTSNRKSHMSIRKTLKRLQFQTHLLMMISQSHLR